MRYLILVVLVFSALASAHRIEKLDTELEFQPPPARAPAVLGPAVVMEP